MHPHFESHLCSVERDMDFFSYSNCCVKDNICYKYHYLHVFAIFSCFVGLKLLFTYLYEKNSLSKRICSSKNFEFAPKRIRSLKNCL